MVEAPTETVEALDGTLSDDMVSHFEDIKSKIREIMDKMKLQPTLAQVVQFDKGTGTKRKVALAIAKA